VVVASGGLMMLLIERVRAWGVRELVDAERDENVIEFEIWLMLHIGREFVEIPDRTAQVELFVLIVTEWGNIILIIPVFVIGLVRVIVNT